MAWENRNGKRYYYRSKRVGNGRQVTKEYYGRGMAAQQAALKDAQRRLIREQDRAKREQWEALDAQVAQLHKLIKLLSHTHLVELGYYQHHRSEWRRRR